MFSICISYYFILIVIFLAGTPSPYKGVSRAIFTINTSLIEKSQAFLAQTAIFIFKVVLFSQCQSDTLIINSWKFRK
jgi:hypothetical protein